MRVRPLGPLAAVLTCGSLLLAAACSSFDGSSPDTTTGTVDRNATTTTTTTTAAPSSSTSTPEGSGVGLWIASPAGIQDESGQLWAKPAPGETLRDPVDDAAGGVFYLRCGSEFGKCTIEHQTAADGTPDSIGEAERLLALGTMSGAQVLLTAWQDPTVAPSFEQNTSGQFARAIDVASHAVIGTYAWYGWESGPFAADVEQDRFALCSGEGEACEMTTFDGAAGDPAPVPGVLPAAVRSLTIDAEARLLTWVAQEPVTGEVTAYRYDIEGGATTDMPVAAAADPAPDEAVTDGAVVAVRTGSKVRVVELASLSSAGGPPPTSGSSPPRPTVEFDVPGDTTQIALRPSGGGGGVSSSL